MLSNAWAGSLYSTHHLQGINSIAGGKDFSFLVSNGREVALVQAGKTLWSAPAPSNVLAIQYQQKANLFWVLSANGLYSFSPVDNKLLPVYTGEGFTCFKVLGNKIILGTHNGYIQLNQPYTNATAQLFTKLPALDITAVEEVAGNLWFGTTNGAFMQRTDGTFDYFASERWLPGNNVVGIAQGDSGSALVLTTKGFAKIATADVTLAQKADWYEKIVRQRHIRYGFYSDYTNVKKGDIATAQMDHHDSDNLWTSMYLTAEIFRYLVTNDEEAKQNCIESLDAMERLFTLSGIEGLFGRCIERSGNVSFKDEIREEEKYYWYPGYDHTPTSWKHTPGGEWDWRGSASSDQAVGQYFALTMAAQYLGDSVIKRKAINLIDKLTGYIVDNGLKLVDVNGKPTLWGRWSPDYVNRFPDMVGDKKLYSSNIISFLQTAWHFTGKEKYRAKALELLNKEHYLQNLARPVKEIGPAPATADKWSQVLSGGWNSSDDEMYFLAYWGLYPYALNDTLKKQYGEAIKDHWAMLRPEKEGLWNLCYGAITGAKDFDLNETVWELKRMPVDLINWSVHNSSRKDLVYINDSLRERFTSEVLPPDERPENKHNRNLFKLDDKSGGSAELGGGDVFLLPYWMGRYFGKISAPVKSTNNVWQLMQASPTIYTPR